VSVALVIQHAKRMRRIVLRSVARLAQPYSSALCLKRHIAHKMCVLIFSTAFVRNISHSKKNSVRHYHKCTQVFMYSIRYSYQMLKELEFSRYIPSVTTLVCMVIYCTLMLHVSPCCVHRQVYLNTTGTRRRDNCKYNILSLG
jgi:hypothetical protein